MNPTPARRAVLTLTRLLHQRHLRFEHVQYRQSFLAQQHTLYPQLITAESNTEAEFTRAKRVGRRSTEWKKTKRWTNKHESVMKVTMAPWGGWRRNGRRSPASLFLLGRTSSFQSEVKIRHKNGFMDNVISQWTSRFEPAVAGTERAPSPENSDIYNFFFFLNQQ